MKSIAMSRVATRETDIAAFRDLLAGRVRFNSFRECLKRHTALSRLSRVVPVTAHGADS